MKNSEVTQRIAAHIETSLARALSSMTGRDFSVKRDKQKGLEELKEPIVWAQSFSFDPESPAFWLLAGRDLWVSAGQITMAAVGIESAADEDCRSTWQEIAGQTIGGIATALTGDLRRDITAAKGEEVAVAPEDVTWATFSAHLEDSVYYFRAGWLPALEALYEQTAPERTEAEEKPAVPPGTNFSKTFDLLLDVALPVSVSFGRTSLQIREVLKLNTGSIVELNRLVAEPVDVVVNDCVIARGEVVVVDGNYGVRVTHLASREDRLRFGMAQTSARVAACAGGAV
jgi:flagellar motor switch protein FliN